MAPSLAPMALRIAISLAFSVIMRSSVQMMQKLATMIAIDRMMNVANPFEPERAEEVLVHLAPVAHPEIVTTDGLCVTTRRQESSARSASSTFTSMAEIFPPVAK